MDNLNHPRLIVWGYLITALPNDDRDGVNVYIECPNGDSCSLACAENEGCTSDGTHVPGSVVIAAHQFIENNNLDY